MAPKQKITPCLWFDDNAEEAMTFYVGIFENSKIVSTSRNPGTGAVLVGVFELDGREFLALNGGPAFNFTEAISLSVDCETQAEIDRFWAQLSAGGSPGRCGWLKDKFGLSWQIVPRVLPALLSGPDRDKANRVMAAMLKMKKLDIATLEQA
jgi:predicted 3-demethylubiquinone-9 3-methyltransferase (glyoxalase superfamily)